MITSIIKIGVAGFILITAINGINKKHISHHENGLDTVNKIEFPALQSKTMFREFMALTDTSKKSKAYNDSIKNVLQKQLEMNPNKKSYQIKPY
jgi:hypothetical protein